MREQDLDELMTLPSASAVADAIRVKATLGINAATEAGDACEIGEAADRTGRADFGYEHQDRIAADVEGGDFSFHQEICAGWFEYV